jgi:hypothetical protein
VADPNTLAGEKRSNYNFYRDVALKLEGTIHVPKGGKYEMVCHTSNRTIVKVDGDKVFDLTFLRIWNYEPEPSDHQTRLTLSPGDHHVEALTYVQAGPFLPGLTLKLAGSKDAPKSLWNGFTF